MAIFVRADQILLRLLSNQTMILFSIFCCFSPFVSTTHQIVWVLFFFLLLSMNSVHIHTQSIFSRHTMVCEFVKVFFSIYLCVYMNMNRSNIFSVTTVIYSRMTINHSFSKKKSNKYIDFIFYSLKCLPNKLLSKQRE